jgi:hypothetical protein
MRKPTHADAELLLRLYEMRREPELRRARAWILSNPPLTWESVKSVYMSHEDADRFVRMVSAYWQMVGTLVNRGIMHPDLFFEHTGEDIVTWDRCKEWIEGARRDLRPSYHVEFEKMVNAHRAYREKQNAALVGRASGSTTARPRRAVRRTAQARG